MERAFLWSYVQVNSLKLLLGSELDDSMLGCCQTMGTHCSGFGGAEIAARLLASACSRTGVRFQLQPVMSCVCSFVFLRTPVCTIPILHYVCSFK